MDDRVKTLVYTLADLYFIQSDIIALLKAAKIAPAMINFSGSGMAIWTNAVLYAEHNNRLDNLINEALQQYPQNGTLLYLKNKQPINSLDIIAKPMPSLPLNIEKEVGFGGMLPMDFLQTGIEMGRSVGRINVKSGFGTGFLIKDGFLLTNWHVLKTIKEAQRATINFWYSPGTPLFKTELSLAPEKGFATGGDLEGGDWTIVKVNDSLEALKEKGVSPLSLKKRTIDIGDRVNIIQHPKGGIKKVGFRSNLVYASSAEFLHYATDTAPGSSGSPVFNDGWEVVALHHAGGNMPDIAHNNLGNCYWTNEGLNINNIIDGINASGLLSL